MLLTNNFYNEIISCSDKWAVVLQQPHLIPWSNILFITLF